MGTHFIRTTHKTHTCIYESRAKFEYVNRNDAGLPATELGFKNQKGDTVKIPTSRHTCRKRGAPTLPSRQESPLRVRFLIVDMLPHLPAIFFYQDFTVQTIGGFV